MGTARGPKLVTKGLVLALDAASPKSYPGSGTTWSDLTGNNLNATLFNGPTFSTDNFGTIVFDGDEAGLKAAENIKGIGDRLGLLSRNVNLGDHIDPGALAESKVINLSDRLYN